MSKNSELISFDEIGYFDNRPLENKVHYAYQTWASLYLNYNDFNFSHFFMRDKDVQPLYEHGLDSSQWDDDELVYDAFVQSSIEFAAEIIEHGTSIRHLLEQYPILKENENKLRMEVAKLFLTA